MKYFIAVVLLFLDIVVSCQGANNCHWGPSYWCQNKTTARECGAIEYCHKNVWKESPLTVGDDVGCEVCKLVVKFGEAQVLSNKTEKEVLQALLQYCNTTGPLAKVCVNFVNDSFDVIWELLVETLSPEDICTKIGLCATDHLHPQPSSKKIKWSAVTSQEVSHSSKIRPQSQSLQETRTMITKSRNLSMADRGALT